LTKGNVLAVLILLCFKQALLYFVTVWENKSEVVLAGTFVLFYGAVFKTIALHMWAN